jgi:hypothetical protein
LIKKGRLKDTTPLQKVKKKPEEKKEWAPDHVPSKG